LTRLPIEKEALLSSGIGKVVLYYTKSKRPEIQIKRTAERLLGEWSRPILKRSDDYKKRKIETRDYDFTCVFVSFCTSSAPPVPSFLSRLYSTNTAPQCSTTRPPPRRPRPTLHPVLLSTLFPTGGWQRLSTLRPPTRPRASGRQ
jgi:transcription factor SPN1